MREAAVLCVRVALPKTVTEGFKASWIFVGCFKPAERKGKERWRIDLVWARRLGNVRRPHRFERLGEVVDGNDTIARRQCGRTQGYQAVWNMEVSFPVARYSLLQNVHCKRVLATPNKRFT